MSNKFGKFLLFSALAGAAAYGAYSYMQKKEKSACPEAAEDLDEEIDEFNEDLDEDLNSEKDRSYVSLNLDKAEALATEAFHKAKEVITDSVHQVKETVKSVAEGQACHQPSSFTDLTSVAKENAAEKSDATETPSAETVTAPADEPHQPADQQNTAKSASEDDQVEEFFDDEDDPSLNAM